MTAVFEGCQGTPKLRPGKSPGAGGIRSVGRKLADRNTDSLDRTGYFTQLHSLSCFLLQGSKLDGLLALI